MSLQDDLAACDRETALTGSLASWVKLAWPQVYPSSPLVWNWHIDLLLDHYEACYTGEIRELVVNLPPGGSKSSLTCVLFPAWVWAKTPERSLIYAAYGEKLVRRDARLFNTLLHSPWWLRRFGDRFTVPTVPAVELIENNKGGFRIGTTPGSEVTGFHGNYQVIDDPNKPEELTKSRWRRSKTGWAAPWAHDGVARRRSIVSSASCSDSTVTIFPACFWSGEQCIFAFLQILILLAERSPLGVQTLELQEGELLDPVRLPAHEIQRLRIALGGMNAAAQLDQSPVPEGGAVFQRRDLQYWTLLPPQFDQVICSWDCAFKDELTSDYVCGQVWGRCGAYFYLIDQVHGHHNFFNTVLQILLLAQKHPAATTKLVEDKANGTAVIETLQTKVPGVVAVDPLGGKFARASAVSGFFESGNVFLPDSKLPGYEWVDQKYIPELLTFPRGKHDDQVDATTQALLYLQQHTSYLKAAMDRVRGEGWGFQVT